MLRLDCVKVEARVVDLKIVQGSRTDLTDPAGRVLVNVCGAEVSEAWNGSAGKRQGSGLILVLVDADEIKLVLLCRAEVEAADVLVELVGLYGVERVGIRT